MAILSVPVCLVEREKEQCTDIIRISADGMSTLSQLQRQLAVGLLTDSKLLEGLTFRGNTLVGDGRLNHFAATNNERPRFTAEYSLMSPGRSHELIFIKTPHSKIISMDFMAQATISDLKRHLKGKVDLPEDQQRLVLSGKQLGDSKTLQESNVQIGSVLHLVLPVQGGLSATSFKFADVSNSKAMQRVELSYNEPRYRYCCCGLNIEGICLNSSCQAYNKEVIDRVGLGSSFNLTADKANCPVCSTQFQPTTCAFKGCQWMYDGRKAGRDGPQDISGTWKEVGNDACYRFKEAGNIIKWYSLVLSTRPPLTSTTTSSECSICFHTLTSANKCTTKCGHSFHHRCLETWKKHMPTEGCPTCWQAV